MKVLCLTVLIYWTILLGESYASFYRAMIENVKSAQSNITTAFDAFDQRIKERIERDKIKKRICGIIRDVCQPQPVKPNITQVKPPDTPTPSSSSSNNFNISLVFSEPSEYSNDTTCMKFRLPPQTSPGKIVTGADVFVYITNRGKKAADKKARRKRRRKRMRKISIKVSLLNEKTQHKKLISRLRFRPNPDKKWYKLVVPFSVIKSSYHLKDRALNLCIDCKRCNSKTQVILPLKTSKKRHKHLKPRKLKGSNKTKLANRKKGKKLRLRKKRPFLMCHTSEKVFQRKRREISQCTKRNAFSQCCRYKEYIRFSDIGLGNRVTYPDGYYKTECIGSCYSNSSHSEQALTQCVPRSYKPLQTVLVFDSDVMFIDIPQGHIQDCNCQ